jgi:hypothetical protein
MSTLDSGSYGPVTTRVSAESEWNDRLTPGSWVTLTPVAKAPNRRVVRKLEQHGVYCAIAAPVWHELVYGCSRLPAGSTALSDGPLRSCPRMTLQRNGAHGSGLDLKKVAKHRPSWKARLRQSPTVEASRSSPPTRKTFDTSINWNWLTGPVDRRLPGCR